MDFNHWLQSRLTSHGYAVGPIDGVIGDNTLKALRAFERAHGLTADGTADPVVIAALRATSSAIDPASAAKLPIDRDKPSRGAEDILTRQWPRQSECMTFYGDVGENQTTIEVPFDLYLAWDTSIRTRKMTLHKKVAGSALRVLEDIASIYSAKDRADLGLNLFGGSLNVRTMRGGSSYSMHSWGIAIDFDPLRNQLPWSRLIRRNSKGLQISPPARLSHDDALPFWRAWEIEGWVSLGRARDFDWMHVQAARL